MLPETWETSAMFHYSFCLVAGQFGRFLFDWLKAFVTITFLQPQNFGTGGSQSGVILSVHLWAQQRQIAVDFPFLKSIINQHAYEIFVPTCIPDRFPTGQQPINC
jgi:hypothetical protein